MSRFTQSFNSDIARGPVPPIDRAGILMTTA